MINLNWHHKFQIEFKCKENIYIYASYLVALSTCSCWYLEGIDNTSRWGLLRLGWSSSDWWSKSYSMIEIKQKINFVIQTKLLNIARRRQNGTTVSEPLNQPVSHFRKLGYTSEGCYLFFSFAFSFVTRKFRPECLIELKAGSIGVRNISKRCCIVFNFHRNTSTRINNYLMTCLRYPE